MKIILVIVFSFSCISLYADTLSATSHGVTSHYQEARKEKQLLLKDINTLISQGEIAKAEELAAVLYKDYPHDKEVMQKYATILFWRQKPEAAEVIFTQMKVDYPKTVQLKAYRQNRLLLHTQHAEKLLNTSPKKALVYIERLSMQERNSYDLHLLYVQSLIRSSALVRAEEEAQKFYRDYPKSEESRHLLANILFWNGKYSQSLKHYEALYAQEQKSVIKEQIANVKNAQEAALKKMDIAQQIKFYKKRYASQKKPEDGMKLARLYIETGATDPAFKLLESMVTRYPRDLEVSRLYMASLLKLYQRGKANHLLYELGEESQEALKEKYPLLYCRTLVNKLEIGGIFYDYSDTRYSDNTFYIQYETPIKEYVAVGRLQETWRYGLRDTKLQADLYRAFKNFWWGYVTFSFSPEANFMPIVNTGAHIYKDIDWLELGFGYEYSHYRTADVHMLIPEYSIFFLQGFTWMQKLYYVPASASYALVSQLGYESNCHYKIQGEYTWSDSNEYIENNDAFQNSKSHMWRFSGEYRFRPEWTVGGALSYSNYYTDVGAYSRSGLNLFIRKAW